MADNRPRLLLAEDDPQLGPLMVRVLEEVYDVTLCADGAEALTAAQQGLFDVLIIDRRLPNIDGVSIVESLRRGGATTPMLILTALGTVQDKVRGLDAGANDYLVKPFEFEELFARLRAIRRVSEGEGPFVRIGTWSLPRFARGLLALRGTHHPHRTRIRPVAAIRYAPAEDIHAQ